MSNIPILGQTTPEPEMPDLTDGTVVLRAEDCADIITAAIAYVQQYEEGGSLDLRTMVRNTLIKTVHTAFDHANEDADAAHLEAKEEL